MCSISPCIEVQMNRADLKQLSDKTAMNHLGKASKAIIKDGIGYNYRYNSVASLEEFKLAVLFLLILFIGLTTLSISLVTSSNCLEISKLHDLID